MIDSKVSLTAYSDAIAAEDDGERERLMKLHAASVRRHIDELAEKDYSKLVDDAIGFVLMFIPNETNMSYYPNQKVQFYRSLPPVLHRCRPERSSGYQSPPHPGDSR